MAYPLTAVHRDAPDFLLTMNACEIGVEVTEATSTEYAAYCALAEHEFPNSLLEPALFRPNTPKRGKAELRAILAGRRLVSSGWGGDSAEREWAEGITARVTAKLDALGRPDFARFRENWLLVYDNLPLPALHMSVAVSALQTALAPTWSKQPHFTHVFVLSGASLIELTCDATRALAVIDVWRSAA